MLSMMMIKIQNELNLVDYYWKKKRRKKKKERESFKAKKWGRIYINQ